MKKILQLLFIIGSSITVSAQGNYSDKQEKIKALLVTHISKDLKLTSQEAEKFWPVYHDARYRMDELQSKKRKMLKDLESKLKSLSDADSQKYVALLDDIDQDKIKIEANAKNDIIKMLGAKRYLTLKNAEMTFRRSMLEEFRERSGRRD